MRQAKQRIFGGDTHAAEKLVSIFEPTTEIIRKGKASKPTEFGKLVKIQETENQIITDYAVYEKRPSDSELVMAAIDAHENRLGRTPRLLAGDAAFYSTKNEAMAHARGVQRVSIPSRSTKSADRKREQKKRWFKQGQKWRTGCEGRISVLKRRHGLRRCLYRGDDGMRRWVGLGVIADNLHHIGKVLAERKS
jgi:IS5 family transposase